MAEVGSVEEYEIDGLIGGHGVTPLWTTIDVLRSEVAVGTVTEVEAFANYHMMVKRGLDPGDHPRGPLDLV